ncbi:MAG: hypothetical protein E3J72_19440 [Planctomycetota bacterium]|nr:MAG: hypothetical protein E3J72_19440 [Planctomycetota bacterium]
MWYRIGYVIGSIVQFVAGSRALHPRQSRGRERSNFLEKLFDLDDNRLSCAALAAAIETGRAMLNRPTVRASLEAAVLKLLRGADEELPSVETVRESADRIALILKNQGIAPVRLGVDGLPGSGKSTLARALADRLGFKWKSLDRENMNVPLDFASERAVYEHQRLLRTQDVDAFDAVIYVGELVEASRARILRRARMEARGSMIIDVLDFDKLKNIGKLAFELCDGKQIPIPGSRLFMKVRPPEGFRAAENIADRLRAAGHNAEGMGKEEMLFLLAYGRARSGLMAYFVPGAYNRELLSGLVAGLKRYLDK